MVRPIYPVAQGIGEVRVEPGQILQPVVGQSGDAPRCQIGRRRRSRQRSHQPAQGEDQRGSVVRVLCRVLPRASPCGARFCHAGFYFGEGGCVPGIGGGGVQDTGEVGLIDGLEMGAASMSSALVKRGA